MEEQRSRIKTTEVPFLKAIAGYRMTYYTCHTVSGDIEELYIASISTIIKANKEK
jgi:hypothetical protein